MQEPTIIGRDGTVAISTNGETWIPVAGPARVRWIVLPTAQALTAELAPVPAPAPAPSREPRHTRSRHIRAVRLWRMRQILRQMPRDVSPATRTRWSLHVAALTTTLGRRQLARVVWPWQPKQPDAGRGMPQPGRARRRAQLEARAAGTRTPRGRPANPTAICE